MRLVILLVLAACGGSPSSEPTPRSGPVASTTPTPAPGDVVVAQVNGRPVYGACVAAQARGKSKAAALDECIAFELLAQEAETRGLAADPRVIDETRTALVDRLVETGFEERYKSPADLATVLDAHIERNKERLDRPEARASAYIRFDVPKGATPDKEWAAKTNAEKLIAKLAGETGLHPAHLVETAIAMFGVQAFTTEDVPLFAKAIVDKPYGDALFAIETVGTIYDKPVRTRWGWDVILLNGVQPAKRYTREEAATEAFPDVRRGYFQIWVNGIAKSLGVKITVDPKPLATLEAGA